MGEFMQDTDPFSGRLLRGEKIVWRGRPQQGLMLTRNDVFLVPFSVMWGGFAIFWEWSVLKAPNTPIFMALWGAPFVLVGLFLIVGRFFVDAWIRGSISYALTDRRILIVRSRPSINFQSVNLDRLPEVSLNETSNGRGTIQFGAMVPIWGNRGARGSFIAALDTTPQFLAIDDARRVFAIVQERAQTPAA